MMSYKDYLPGRKTIIALAAASAASLATVATGSVALTSAVTFIGFSSAIGWIISLAASLSATKEQNKSLENNAKTKDEKIGELTSKIEELTSKKEKLKETKHDLKNQLFFLNLEYLVLKHEFQKLNSKLGADSQEKIDPNAAIEVAPAQNAQPIITQEQPALVELTQSAMDVNLSACPVSLMVNQLDSFLPRSATAVEKAHAEAETGAPILNAREVYVQNVNMVTADATPQPDFVGKNHFGPYANEAKLTFG